jgi:hypothetical protein
MSVTDTAANKVEPHVDTPAQAEARASALAKHRAKADAKTAKAAAQRAGKKDEKAVPAAPAPEKKGPPLP